MFRNAFCPPGRARSLVARTILLCGLVVAPPARAQAPAEPTKAPPTVPDSVALHPGPWTLGLTVGLGVTQSAFSSNWSGGDQGALAWSARSDVVAERQASLRFNLKNQLGLAFGQTSQQVRDPDDPSRRTWDAAEKTTDLIFFETTGRWTLSGWADPYASLRLDTQFRDESSPLGRIGFNPIKLKETAGAAKVFKKSSSRELISRVGLGLRQTLGRSIVEAEPRRVESFSSNDGGFEWYTTMKHPLAGGRIQYRGDLLVFTPVFYSANAALEEYDTAQRAVDPGHRDVAGYWRSPDVNWRNAFSSRITRVLSVDLFVQLVYDKFDTAANLDIEDPLVQHSEIQRNIRRSGQFKQTLALGLSYALR